VPGEALAKAVAAYGDDIERKGVWVVNMLRDREELRQAAETMQMDPAAATRAIAALRADFSRLWPHAPIADAAAW
jgi:hypothetical protein